MTERTPYRHHLDKDAYFDLLPPRVPSSNIKGYAYDEAKKRLTVQFHDGGLYHYDGVKPHEYSRFDQAESTGRHFHAHVKGKYPSTRADKPRNDSGRP